MRDLAEEVHLQNVCELRRFDLERFADVVEQFGGDEGRSGHIARTLLLRIRPEGIGVEIHIVLQELRPQQTIISCVPQRVELFIGVFDG